MSVIDAMVATGVVPLVTCDEPSIAVRAAQALARGGARVVELTDRGTNTAATLTALTAAFAHDEVHIGVGSVVDAATAARFVDGGARFVVGPGLVDEVAGLCAERGVPYVPGCATPTEVLAAFRAGSSLVKVFPAASLGGPGYVRAILAPLRGARLMVTGGVRAERDEVTAYIEAGAACVGLSGLAGQQRLRERAWDEVCAAAEAALGWVGAARAGAMINDNNNRGRT